MSRVPFGWDSVDTSIPDDEVIVVGDDDGDDFEDEFEFGGEAELDDSPDEIDYDDWVTGDGCIFRHSGTGRIVLDATDMSDAQAGKAASRIMTAEGFWPNVWYVSDHGNVSIFQF